MGGSWQSTNSGGMLAGVTRLVERGPPARRPCTKNLHSSEPAENLTVDEEYEEDAGVDGEGVALAGALVGGAVDDGAVGDFVGGVLVGG